ncbi:MAG: response regulator, partial [Desulfoplanes sp.]|nr:response regulator [Desulfoplanes sp.]
LTTHCFDLWELIEEVVTFFSLSAAEKGLDIDFSIHPNTPQWVQGDSERLRQILINIIGNAVKFTETGKVVIRTAPASSDTLYVLMFEIQDTGIGIPQEAISNIFDPFGQADETMTRKFGGTGLGLSISKELVGMMGGKLGVKSAVGKGSLFWFDVKLTPAMPSNTGDNLFSKENIASRRVLFVSPNIMNQRSLSQIMRRHEVSCTTIHPDETDTIEKKVKDGQFNIVILENNRQFPLTDSFLNVLASIRSSNLWIAQIQSEQEIQRPGLNIRSSLTLPLRQSECFNILIKSLELENDPPNPLEGQTQGTQEQFPLSLLLVDDNEINQQVATEAFNYWGCKVSIATNGQEALTFLEQGTYDLVFMDCQMPVMDGYEATQKIREKEKQSQNNHRIPIIAMTAHAMPTDKQRCLAAGMDDYLSKPFGLEDIKKCLKRWNKTIGGEHGAGKTEALSA